MSNEGVTQGTARRGVSTDPMATNGAIVEPRTKLEKAETEDMFLTPRVLDASAFAKYAETLKGIIAQASEQGRTSLIVFTLDRIGMYANTPSSIASQRSRAWRVPSGSSVTTSLRIVTGSGTIGESRSNMWYGILRHA